MISNLEIIWNITHLFFIWQNGNKRFVGSNLDIYPIYHYQITYHALLQKYSSCCDLFLWYDFQSDNPLIIIKLSNENVLFFMFFWTVTVYEKSYNWDMCWFLHFEQPLPSCRHNPLPLRTRSTSPILLFWAKMWF